MATSASLTSRETHSALTAGARILTLPDEILSPILQSVIDAEAPIHQYMRLYDIRRRSELIIRLRLVCRRWDAVIIATTTLWSYLRVPLESLRYGTWDYIEQALTSHLAKLDRTPFTLEVDAPFSSIVRLKKVLNFLRPRLSQCRRLHIASYFSAEVAAATRAFLQAGPFPLTSLDTLVLEYLDQDTCPPHLIAASEAPEVLSHLAGSLSLTSLVLLQHWPYDTLPSASRGASLRSVLLSNISLSSLSSLDVINFMEPFLVLELAGHCARTLRRMSWKHHDHRFDAAKLEACSKPIHLPLLQSLTLIGAVPLDKGTLFDAPHLERLELRPSPEFPAERLRVVIRAFPSVTRLIHPWSSS